MNDVIHIIPKDACPKCGQRRWVITSFQSDTYYTNNFGKIDKSIENFHTIVGKCLTCDSIYEMYPAYDTFIPLTDLRKKILEYSPKELDKTNNIDYTYIDNPMEKEII